MIPLEDLEVLEESQDAARITKEATKGYGANILHRKKPILTNRT
jgi:hypothetical protein